MDIVIIGSGNVAGVLGKKFKAAGHRILQIVSHNASAASKLAYELDTKSTNYLSLVNNSADIYLIAVSDDAIAKVAGDLKLQGKIVVHTAAAVSKEVLKNVSTHYGVFYPLQTLRNGVGDLPEIPVYFDGSDELVLSKLEMLARSIAPGQSIAANDQQRLKMHVAAVVVNNFTNHLYALAEQYCHKEGLDFTQLLPLIEETVARIRITTPSLAQTGPAIRHDKETVEKHLQLLNDHPELRKVYEVMTRSIGGGS